MSTTTPVTEPAPGSVCAWPVFDAAASRPVDCGAPAVWMAVPPPGTDEADEAFRPVCAGHVTAAESHQWVVHRRYPVGQPPDPAAPARGLADFECFSCGIVFKADEDTQTCVRCDSRRLGVMTPEDAERRAAGETVPYRSPQPSPDELAAARDDLEQRPVSDVPGAPTEAELRAASVEALVDPTRQRLDAIWADIASTIVTVAGAGRRVVTEWRKAPDVRAPVSVYEAILDLAVALGIEEGSTVSLPEPHVELLRETAGMMRAEADRAVNGGVLRGQGVARRLREQADVIDTTVGRG
jgi:hypothetical protein